MLILIKYDINEGKEQAKKNAVYNTYTHFCKKFTKHQSIITLNKKEEQKKNSTFSTSN